MKILEQLSAACRTMNFAKSTEECYSAWVEDFLRFHRQQAGKWIHPDQLRESAVEQFLTDLAVRRKLSVSSSVDLRGFARGNSPRRFALGSFGRSGSAV